MKKIMFLVLYFPITLIGQNLVLNPSFEDTVSCPFFLGDLSPIVDWDSYGNSPDCFHSCSGNTINIPNSDFGYQYARSGEAMSGIITYVWQQDPGWPYYREYIGTQLLNPLIIGEKYFVSFFINCAGYMPGWQHIGSNKIGARFYTYTPMGNILPDNFAHIYTDSIVIDTVQWYKVSGSFIADSTYTHLIIGNFYDHTQTDTIIFGGPPFGGSSAYYYIDDVCVTTDSLYNENWTGIITKKLSDNFSIYPNPSSDFIHIKANAKLQNIVIFNSIGQIIFSKENIYKSEDTIDIRNIEKGIYYLKINDFYTTKIVIK